jgi:myo-inositol-1(or 4)-monophosphatase
VNAPDVTSAVGLEAVLAVTRAAAREAASLVLEGFRRHPAVEYKGVVDLVTSYDRASEALLRRRLGEALPFSIVGEEEGGESDSVVFYVDPLDGTTNFVHGHPFWCVSVGLVVAGAPVLGVVLSPPLGLEFFGWVAPSGERRAARGAGHDAMIAEERCVVSSTATLAGALLATGFPYDRRTSSDNNFDAFVALKRQCQAIRRCGSAALDLCFVADGTYDGYWERKVRRWDIAGGIAIVRAAGGRVTDFENGARYLESGSVIATNGRIHDVLLGELARVAR